MAWTTKIEKKALREFDKLDKPIKKKLFSYIEKKIATLNDPRQLGAPLDGKLGGYWKYRIGDYRLICQIEDKTFTILVVKVGHRKHVYK